MTGTFRRYLIDKSALARMTHPEVARVLQPLFDSDSIATCSLVDLEILYSTRSRAEYEQELADRQASYHLLPITQAICERAVQVQRALAEKAHHRGASLPDLLIASCAEAHSAVLIHYDADYDLIASVTNQPVMWVAPRGSID